MEFTNNWFEVTARANWDAIISTINPRKILEIGSYEGASVCYIINKLGNTADTLEIHAVDTWEGGSDHKGIDMCAVEDRFKRNVKEASDNKLVDLRIHKGRSHEILLLLSNYSLAYFDFIYVDGSHETPEVLTDAVLGFHLLKPGGVMCFDDYHWTDGKHHPKHAIDAFTNIFSDKIRLIPSLNSQVFVRKK